MTHEILEHSVNNSTFDDIELTLERLDYDGIEQVGSELKNYKGFSNLELQNDVDVEVIECKQSIEDVLNFIQHSVDIIKLLRNKIKSPNIFIHGANRMRSKLAINDCDNGIIQVCAKGKYLGEEINEYYEIKFEFLNEERSIGLVEKCIGDIHNKYPYIGKKDGSLITQDDYKTLIRTYLFDPNSGWKLPEICMELDTLEDINQMVHNDHDIIVYLNVLGFSNKNSKSTPPLLTHQKSQ